MSNVKYPEITVNIIGVDSNAFNILGICTREMRNHRLPKSGGVNCWEEDKLNRKLVFSYGFRLEAAFNSTFTFRLR